MMNNQISASPEQVQAIQNQIANNPELLQKIQQNPELLSQLYQDYAGKEQANSDEMALAQELQSRQGAQGVTAGNQYVAANPMSHLADAGRQGLAAYQMNKARKARDKLSADKEAALTGTVSLMTPEKKAYIEKQQAEARALNSGVI